MTNRGRDPVLGQAVAQLFGNRHRAVVAARAADPDGQIGLALGFEMRDEKGQHLVGPIDELLRRLLTHHVIGHSLICAAQWP